MIDEALLERVRGLVIEPMSIASVVVQLLVQGEPRAGLTTELEIREAIGRLLNTGELGLDMEFRVFRLPGHWSKVGRCPTCEGTGVVKLATGGGQGSVETGVRVGGAGGGGSAVSVARVRPRHLQGCGVEARGCVDGCPAAAWDRDHG
jgi:hypothetical protein